MLHLSKLLTSSLLVLLLCSQTVVFAQSRFTHISVNEGLSQSTGMAVIQDDDGFMWLGTTKGLNRYDGYEVKPFYSNYRNESSLSDDYITSLLKGTNNTLWVGTRDGINRLHTRSYSVERITISSSKNANDVQTVRSVFQDSQGSIWIGKRDGEICQYQEKENRFVCTSFAFGSIETIAQYTDKTFFVGTSKGLYQFDPTTKQFSPFIGWDENEKKDIRSLFRISNEQWLIGTFNKGLFLVNTFQNTVKAYQSDNETPEKITSIISHKNKKGLFFISTWGNGLKVLDINTSSFRTYLHDYANPRSLADNQVRVVYQDTSNLVWIGTFTGGFSRFNPDLVHFEQEAEKPTIGNNNIYDVIEDKQGNIWIASYDGGVSVYNTKTGTFTIYKHDPKNSNSLSDDRVRSLFQDSKGNIWIATWGTGLNKFDPKTKTFFHYRYTEEKESSRASNALYILQSDHIDSVLETPNGSLWVSTANGLHSLNPITNEVMFYTPDASKDSAISSEKTTRLYFDHEKTLWIATDGGGLNKYKDGKFVSYKSNLKDQSTINSNYVYSIFEDSQRRLWVGTTKGLALFNRNTGSFQRITGNNQLSNAEIWNIKENRQGALLLATTNGLFQFNPANNTYKLFTYNDGLNSNELKTLLFDSAHNLLVGGVGGLDIIPPSFSSSKPSKLWITGIYKRGNPIQINLPILTKGNTFVYPQISVDYQESFLQIKFSLLDYTNPKGNHFWYKIIGIHDEWQSLGTTPEFYFPTLQNGTYLLQIKASSNFDIQSQNVIEIPIKVNTSSTQIILIILGLLLFIIGLRWLWKQYKNRERKQKDAQMIRMMLAKKSEEEKIRIARDLHDDSLQDMNTFALELSMIAMVSNTPNSVKEKLNESTQKLQLIASKIRNVCDDLRPSVLIHHGIVDAIYSKIEILSELHSDTEIIFKKDIEEKYLEGYFEEDNAQIHLYRIVQEALNNALQHGKAKKILVHLTCNEQELRFKIQDDGNGFHFDRNQSIRYFTAKKHFGLAGMYERAEILGGTLDITSTQGSTTILFILPSQSK